MHGRATGGRRKSGPQMDGRGGKKDTPTQGHGGGGKGKGDMDEVKGPYGTLQGRCRRWSRCVCVTGAAGSSTATAETVRSRTATIKKYIFIYLLSYRRGPSAAGAGMQITQENRVCSNAKELKHTHTHIQTYRQMM